MSIGYREIVDSVDGATLSRDESARRLRKEIEENGIQKIFRYPLNGIPEVEDKPLRRPS